MLPFKLNKIIKDVDPDVIHAHIANHYGVMCLFNRKPLALALWGSEIMLDPYQGSTLRKLFFRCINWISLKRADWCHTSGFHIVAQAQKQYKNIESKTDIFYWGFPL